MRTIPFETVAEAVCGLCGKAACDLPPDLLSALREGAKRETSPLGQEFFRQYLENADIAAKERLPLCQDTGFAVYFAEMGVDCRIDRGTLEEALNEGTRRGYRKFHLRKSILSDPVFDRKNTFDNTPVILHLKQVPGERLHIILAPKGGGSENMSALKMLKPADGRAGIVKFVVESVVNAGGNPCPPVIVGVGIGGTMEKVSLLAKQALLRPVGTPSSDPRYAELEREITEKINAAGHGPQGLGGSVTALCCNIEFFPCHLAALPVAVNMNCHAARHAEVTL